MSEPHKLTIELSGDEMDALWRLSRETFPGHSLELLARKLVQDSLIACGVLSLSPANRSKGARRG